MTQASPDTSFLAHLVTNSMKVWYSKHVGLDQDTLCAQGCGQRKWTSVTYIMGLTKALGHVDV